MRILFAGTAAFAMALSGCAPEDVGDLPPEDGGVLPPGRDAGTTPRPDGSAGVDRPGTPADTGVPPRTDGGTTPGARENCATPFDDDNDGVANEDCPCAPGTMQMCFQRPEDQFRGMCRLGQQRCVGTGEFGTWSPCERAWLPVDAMNRCEVTQPIMEGMATRAPVDILWFVDTSGSMVEETMYVNDNLNRFATALASSGLDYHVIMIARRGTGVLQVCVPPPLAGAGCADGPRFLHVNQSVGSTNGLQQVLATNVQWRAFLRPGSVKAFVAVTDDESSISADAFHTQITAVPGFSSYVFNSIVGYESRSDCPTMARRGGVYLTLTDRTRGERARVCATDWSSIFTSFARSISMRANAWTLGSQARADTVQVWVVAADGSRRQLMSGWSYDMATNRVTVDPAALPPAGSRIEIVYRPASASP